VIDPRRFGDEREHVKAFAAMHDRFDAEWIDAAGLSFDHKLDAIFLLAGAAPRNGMNLHWIHEVSRVAKARGCDVLLTGAMGNATFSFDGSGALPGWFARGEWPRLWRELRAAERDTGFMRMVASRLVMPLLPQPIAQSILRWRHGEAVSILDSWCPLNPDYAREMRVEERAADMGFAPYFQPVASTRVWRSSIMGNASNESGDLQGAFDTIHGIPQRDPTAYRPLVEFCLGIPDDQYLRDGQSRWLARRMLKARVPDMVLNEKRRGRQAVDWHLRMGRERAALAAEVERLQGDPAIAHRLNLSGLASALADWPATTPSGPLANRLELALSRGLTTARFIRYVEGSNA
jgi:asparagine synthase (glutamine-hydrolysing)